MIELDDFERDFDGALQAMIDDAAREYESIPAAERDDFYLWKSAEHLARMIELKAPDCLIEMAEKSLMRRLRRRSKARRDQPA